MSKERMNLDIFFYLNSPRPTGAAHPNKGPRREEEKKQTTIMEWSENIY